MMGENGDETGTEMVQMMGIKINYGKQYDDRKIWQLSICEG
jgi:hypothetical protein